MVAVTTSLERSIAKRMNDYSAVQPAMISQPMITENVVGEDRCSRLLDPAVEEIAAQ